MLKISQYPRNADGTPMDMEVGVLTDTTGNNGQRLTNVPVGPDNAPIDAKAFVLVNPDGSPANFNAGQVATSRVTLSNVSTLIGTAYLAEPGREGTFVFSTANLSTQVTADPQQGVLVAPASDTTGASGAWVRKFTGPISAAWFGAVGDGVADDTAAVVDALTYAISSGLSVDGGPHLYAVAGTLEFQNSANPHIHRLRLKQLAPAIDTKTLYFLNADSIRIDSLFIDAGSDAAGGDMNSSGGLWIDGGANHRVSNVEVTGSGKRSYITIWRTSKSLYDNLHVHDIVFDDAAAPDDVLQGIWLSDNIDCQVTNPVVENLSGNAQYAGVTYPRLRTRGIAGGANVRVTIFNPTVNELDQGIDLSGDGLTGAGGNLFVQVIGGRSYRNLSQGLKFANTSQDCLVVGFVSEQSGAWGFVISGQADGAASPYKTRNIDFIGCLAKDTGADGVADLTTMGFNVQAASGASGVNLEYPQGIRFIGCRAIDTQTAKTMQFGFRSNITYVSGMSLNETISCVVEGATVADYEGFHAPKVRLEAADLAVPNNVLTTIPWTAEDEDTAAMHDVTNPERVTIQKPGTYNVKAKVGFSENGSGYRRIMLNKNGVRLFDTASAPVPVGGGPTQILMNETLDLVPGDYLSVVCDQTAGSNLTVSGYYFIVERVEPV